MAYYPTYAFFSDMPGGAALAKFMLATLGHVFTHLGVEVPGGATVGHLETDSERARQLLDAPQMDIERFVLSCEYHGISFWLVRHEFVELKFLDFDSELYDGMLTNEMRQEKRRVALELHAALLRVGAFLTYTESGEDKAGTSVERAAHVAVACASGDARTIRRELQDSSELWLVAVQPGSVAAACLDSWLSADFTRVFTAEDQGAVYEHLHERPYFLWKKEE